MAENDNCENGAGIQVNITILPEQFKCLEQYGCFVAKLCKCESLPAGQLVIVTYDDQTKEVVVVGIQEVPRGREGFDKQDFYVFASKEDVTVVE